jgi:hypothetical protein
MLTWGKVSIVELDESEQPASSLPPELYVLVVLLLSTTVVVVDAAGAGTCKREEGFSLCLSLSLGFSWCDTVV